MIALTEAFALAAAMSADAFAASLAYGSGKIKIPMISVHIINLICCAVLGLSLFAGSVIREYIPESLTESICFILLLLMGILKLLDSVTKSVIKKYNNISKEIRFSMFNFKFILNLYANPEDADIDASRTISPREAASLAAALSLDGLAIGFGAAIGNMNVLTVLLCSLVTNELAVILGCHAGNKIAHKLPFNLSWASGFLLIILAFTRKV